MIWLRISGFCGIIETSKMGMVRRLECENCKGTNFSLEKWARGYSRGGLRLIRSMLVCNCCGTRRVREYANESKLSEAFPDIDIMQYMGK